MNTHICLFRSAGQGARAQQLIRTLFAASLPLGLLCTALNVAIPVSTFTRSSVVQECVLRVRTQCGVSQMLVFMTVLLDGIFIGTNLKTTLAYSLTALILCYTVLGCGQLNEYMLAALLSTSSAWLFFLFAIRRGQGLMGFWNGLVIFSIIRLVFYAIRFPALYASLRRASPHSSSDETFMSKI